LKLCASSSHCGATFNPKVASARSSLGGGAGAKALRHLQIDEGRHGAERKTVADQAADIGLDPGIADGGGVRRRVGARHPHGGLAGQHPGAGLQQPVTPAELGVAETGTPRISGRCDVDVLQPGRRDGGELVGDAVFEQSLRLQFVVARRWRQRGSVEGGICGAPGDGQHGLSAALRQRPGPGQSRARRHQHAEPHPNATFQHASPHSRPVARDR